MKFLTFALMTIMQTSVIGMTQASTTHELQKLSNISSCEQNNNLSTQRNVIDDFTSNSQKQQIQSAKLNDNFKAPIPPKWAILKTKKPTLDMENNIKTSETNIPSEDFDNKKFDLIETSNGGGLFSKKNDGTQVVKIFDKEITQQDLHDSALDERFNKLFLSALPEVKNTQKVDQKMLRRKKRIDKISNEKRLSKFLIQDFESVSNVDNKKLQKQILNLSKFVYSNFNEYSKSKMLTIQQQTRQIGRYFLLKPLFLFKFSKTAIGHERIKRFNSFWRLLMINGLLTSHEISYMNDLKCTETIFVENTALIKRIENIVNLYISNAEKTIKKNVYSMYSNNHLNTTVEYEKAQIECFMNVLQNTAMRNIPWNIKLSDKTTPRTIGALFDRKLKPILCEYLNIFNNIKISANN